MNLIIDEAEEVYIGKAASKPRRPLGEQLRRSASHFDGSLRQNVHKGRILLKGDNITLIQPVQLS
jgi:small nuclear ribonucleoprotein (snRNP)-like protein